MSDGYTYIDIVRYAWIRDYLRYIPIPPQRLNSEEHLQTNSMFDAVYDAGTYPRVWIVVLVEVADSTPVGEAWDGRVRRTKLSKGRSVKCKLQRLFESRTTTWCLPSKKSVEYPGKCFVGARPGCPSKAVDVHSHIPPL